MCLIICLIVDNTFFADLFEKDIIYDPMNFYIRQHQFTFEYINKIIYGWVIIWGIVISVIIWILNYDSMNLQMNIWIVVDKPILKLICDLNIICLVVDNIYLLDNANKLIYECVIFIPVVDNSFLGDLFENGIIYDHLNF